MQKKRLEEKHIVTSVAARRSSLLRHDYDGRPANVKPSAQFI